VIRDGEEKKVFRVVALDVEEGASLTVVEQDKFQRGQSFSAPPPPRTEPSKWYEQHQRPMHGHSDKYVK
jgi:hypothetical protein